MSKGSRIVKFRVKPEMEKEIEAIIAGSTFRFAGKWTWTTWLTAAAQEKLDHGKRSRGRRRKRKGPNDE